MVNDRKKTRGSITAKELMDQLMQDPDYVAKLREDERKQQQNRTNYHNAAEGVLNDLRDIGYDLETVGELVYQFGRTHTPYNDAIPVLMRWLPQVSYISLRDDIIRTLSVPWAKPAATRLMIEQFYREETSFASTAGLRWTVGNALEVIADDSVFEDLIKIVKNREFGRDREMVALALGKMKDPKAIDILIELLNDEDVVGHAIMAIGKLKAQKARPHIERFLNHRKTWIRNEAKKAIKRIDKANK